MDRGRLGDQREQPPRAVLCDHPLGEEAAGDRNRRLDQDRRDRQSAAREPAVTTLRVLGSRLLGTLRSRTRDTQLNEEIATHLELLTDEFIARGLSPHDARLAARREFGGVAAIHET